MDTMESTKIIGSLCGALLIFLLLAWAGDSLYHVGATGHDGAKPTSGYPIEITLADTGSDTTEQMSMAEMIVIANAGKGKKVFSKCKACHKLQEGANNIGPHLFGVIDRDIGSISDFKYSTAMTDVTGNWDIETLNAFLIKPSAYINGTKMSFAGLKRETDRANVIKYLQSLQ